MIKIEAFRLYTDSPVSTFKNWQEKFIGNPICADSEEALKEIPDNSIDAIVTDIPYGLSFMGKEWDTFKATRQTESQLITNLGAGMRKTTKSENLNYQEWITSWAIECLRVLKPGSFFLCCMTPRQDLLCRAIIGFEDAGFDTGFSSIYWTFAQGFPKAQNLSKAVDKRKCREQLEARLGRKATKEEFEEEWKGFRKFSHYRIEPRGDIMALQPSAETSGKRNGEIYGIYSKPLSEWKKITSSTTPEAQALEGCYSGFQPKPALEVVLVCQKPLSEKNYINQGLAYYEQCQEIERGEREETDIQVGGMNLDAGRIPTEKDLGRKNKDKATWGTYGNGENKQFGIPVEQQGRFPGNLLISDNVLDTLKTTKSSASGYNFDKGNQENPSHVVTNIKSGIHHGDSGGFSRYFSLDAWFEERIKELPPDVQKTFPFIITPKPSRDEKNFGCEGYSLKGNTPIDVIESIKKHLQIS